MPYRYAHYVILLVLLPAIAVAFTPHYFGDLPAASFAFHAHGVTASLWVVLVMAQSWTAHARRFSWHKWIARSVLVLVPLFAAGGVLAMQSMATKFVTRSDPFYAVPGARLGLDDVVATIALVLMVRAARPRGFHSGRGGNLDGLALGAASGGVSRGLASGNARPRRTRRDAPRGLARPAYPRPIARPANPRRGWRPPTRLPRPSPARSARGRAPAIR